MSGRSGTLVAALVGAAASLAFSPGPPSREKIAFLRLTGSFWQVWQMEPDGAAARQLTHTPVDKVMAAWRPASRELLYHTQAGETFLLDTATGQEQRLLNGLFVTDAAWSLDGKQLAYGLPPSDLARGRTTLWTSSPGGDDRRQLAGGPGVDALAPSWLPDGGSLLFRQCTNRNYIEVNHDFWAMKPAAEAESPCPIQGDDEPLKFDQSVSSDGVIAYSSARGGFYEIWINDPGRGPARQVTHLGAYAGNPTWSPDARWIVFDSSRDGAVQIYRVRPDGSGLARLTTGDAPSRKPAWGPAFARRKAQPRNWCAPAAAVPGARQPTARAGQVAGNRTSPLAISWVSIDRPSFEPAKDEQLTVRFRLSAPASVELRFLDADGREVRTITHTAAAAGEQELRWDGKDEQGRLVRPEAYTYVIAARNASGETTYDLRGQTEGEVVWARNIAIDAATGRVSYTLSDAGRVRVAMIREDTTCPIATLLDWVPREPGQREETWDGWDETHTKNYLGTAKLLPLISAYSLPKNAVIVNGQPAGAGSQGAAGDRATGRTWPATAGLNRKLYLHARHPRAACYNPKLSLTFPDLSARTAEGVPLVSRPTPLRVEAAAPPSELAVTPLPRLSVFLYADGVMVERSLSGYVPYQWIVDPARLGPGDHVITAIFVWRDDHFGIAHTKLRVDPAQSTQAVSGGGF